MEHNILEFPNPPGLSPDLTLFLRYKTISTRPSKRIGNLDVLSKTKVTNFKKINDFTRITDFMKINNFRHGCSSIGIDVEQEGIQAIFQLSVLARTIFLPYRKVTMFLFVSGPRVVLKELCAAFSDSKYVSSFSSTDESCGKLQLLSY